MVSWATIKSLAVFLGPILLPKAITYYRSVRTKQPARPIRPVPPKTSRALLLLFLVSSAFLLSTLPIFSPENIFRLCDSRLQIPVDVLFTRLEHLRPHGLTAEDSMLRAKLGSMESKLLYIKYGPSVIMDCQFCSPERPDTYLYYAIPALLTPHLFNLFALALATSSLIAGREGAVWRKSGTIAALVAIAGDIAIVGFYNHQGNARSTRLQEIDAFFWNMNMYRSLALSVMDILFGFAMYLSSTNRMFAEPESPAERIESVTKLLESLRNKINATAVLHNTVQRDDGLRARKTAFWAQDVRVQNEAMEDKDVVEGVNDAISQGRLNLTNISRDAEIYARNATSGLRIMSKPG